MREIKKPLTMSGRGIDKKLLDKLSNIDYIIVLKTIQITELDSMLGGLNE